MYTVACGSIVSGAIRDRGSNSLTAFPTSLQLRAFVRSLRECGRRSFTYMRSQQPYSERLVDIAHAADARVIFTYHTPTASCARGTMMLFGKTPCDGVIEAKRCVGCASCGVGYAEANRSYGGHASGQRFTRGPRRSRECRGSLGAACAGLHRVRPAALSRFHW